MCFHRRFPATAGSLGFMPKMKAAMMPSLGIPSGSHSTHLHKPGPLRGWSGSKPAQSFTLNLNYWQQSAKSDLARSQRIHVPKIVYTLAPKYQYRDYFKAEEYTIWVHGSFGDSGLSESQRSGLKFRLADEA